MSRAILMLFVSGVVALGACTKDQSPPVDPAVGGTKYPNVGLYTPGSMLGLGQQAPTPADSGPMEAAAGDTVMGDRCVPFPDKGSGGTLAVSFTSMKLTGRWSPSNIGAVWIESADGSYVKTLERWAGIRVGSLFRWGEHACTAKLAQEVEVVSMATYNTARSHQSMWSGKDFNKDLVPDGKYVLWIEVTDIDTDYGPYATFEFDKGTMPWTMTPPDKGPVTGLKLMFTPNAVGDE